MLILDSVYKLTFLQCISQDITPEKYLVTTPPLYHLYVSVLQDSCCRWVTASLSTRRRRLLVRHSRCCNIQCLTDISSNWSCLIAQRCAFLFQLLHLVCQNLHVAVV